MAAVTEQLVKRAPNGEQSAFKCHASPAWVKRAVSSISKFAPYPVQVIKNMLKHLWECVTKVKIQEVLLLTVENTFAFTLKTRELKAAKWRCHEWITQCQQQCPGRLDGVDANEWFTVQTSRSSIWSGSDDFLLLSQVLSITYHNVFITQQPACSDTDRNFHANSWWSQVVVWEGLTLLGLTWGGVAC